MEARASLRCDGLTKSPDYAAKTNVNVTSNGTDCNGMSRNSTNGHFKDICAN